MEKATQNMPHLLPFKKKFQGEFSVQKKKRRRKRRLISNVLGRKIFVLSHFNSKYSLIYEMTAFCLLSTFDTFSPFSQCFRICGSIFSLFHISFLPFKVEEDLKIEWRNT